jgi:hypothetical protein
MNPVTRLFEQHVSVYPSGVISLLSAHVTPDRFWTPDGFLVAEFLQALDSRLALWQLADTPPVLPPPSMDDSGWRKAVNAGFRGKIWLTKRDGKVRFAHEKRHKEDRDIFERFSKLFPDFPGPMYPRDSAIAPADRYNCRCRLAFLL